MIASDEISLGNPDPIPLTRSASGVPRLTDRNAVDNSTDFISLPGA